MERVRRDVRGHSVGSSPKRGTGGGDGGQVCRILFGDRLRPAATYTYWPICSKTPQRVSDSETPFRGPVNVLLADLVEYHNTSKGCTVATESLQKKKRNPLRSARFRRNSRQPVLRHHLGELGAVVRTSLLP